MLDRIIHGDQRFFLNSQEIPGVQSVSAQFQTNSSPMLYLGNSAFRGIPISAPSANVSVNRYLVTQDYFIGLTGATGFNGYILRDRTKATQPSERFVSFVSGYMTSYSLQIGLDGIPQNSVKFDVFNRFGGFTDLDNQSVYQNLTDIINHPFDERLKTVAPWSIDLNIDNQLNTSRIQNFQLQITPNYTPLYSLGNRYPVKVEINYPIQVNCSFAVEVDGYQFNSLENFPGATDKRNISLTLRSPDLNETVVQYGFNECELISETYTEQVDGHVLITANYRTFLGRT